jgi:hypothetical protein
MPRAWGGIVNVKVPCASVRTAAVITFPDAVLRVRLAPAVRGRTTPEIVNGVPALTEVGGSMMRFLEIMIDIGCVTDAARSHEASVLTRTVTDLPIKIGRTYVPSDPVTPVVKVRTVPSG